MKNILLALSFVMVSTSLFAQNKNTKAADKLFNQYEYVAAAKSYLGLVEKNLADGYVYKQLADSYYNIFNTDEAIKWYSKAIETKQVAETYFRYAQMLKASKKYDEASIQMKKFAELAPTDLRAKANNENANFVTKILNKKPDYTLKPIEINSDKSDFGAILQGNELFFTSSRNTSSKNYGWTKEPYLDIYKSILSDAGTYSIPVPVASLNSKFHDGPVCFSKDGNTAYFTSASFRENSFVKDKVNNSKLGKNFLFKATKSGESWVKIKSLPFNSTNYSTSNPAISIDGKSLYFSSDMPGSLGGIDIWKVAINEDGTFGKPENLGNKVNTEGNESFPFIDDDNTLYFSSTGKQGLGGLDIFKVDLSKIEEAINVGKPINGEKDDFAFSLNKSKNIAYFSSNRDGNDHIFQAIPICGFDIKTLVSNSKLGGMISNAKVSLVDEKNNVIVSDVSNDKGEVNFRADCEKSYSVQVVKDGFDANSFPIAKSKGGEVSIIAALVPIEPVITEKEIILQPIYFEYNKSNITLDGAVELDKLVQVLNENDKLIIFTKSHTDNRGSDAYNLNLSDQRAKSTVQYLISKGIRSTRITGKGFGESEPKIPCGESCTEEQFAQNRRSEFLIVK